MIRKWTILGTLAAIVLMLLWNFTNHAILYSPFDEIQRSAENETVAESTKSEEFKHAWGTEILNKNIFSPSRSAPPKQVRPQDAARKVPAIETPPPPPPLPRPDVVLNGIIRDENNEFIVILSINNQEAVSMRKGDKVDGIEVTDIRERSATMRWDNKEDFTLSMQTSKTINR